MVPEDAEPAAVQERDRNDCLIQKTKYVQRKGGFFGIRLTYCCEVMDSMYFATAASQATKYIFHKAAINDIVKKDAYRNENIYRHGS